jgi:hypothetical protein
MPQSDSGEDSDYIIRTEDEIQIIIPHGTGAAVEAGQYPVLIHNDIILTLGKQDRLTIRNDDVVDHTIGLFFVGAGQSISQRFTRPAILEGTCSFQGGNVRIIIVESG